ncbi:MAG: DSD1 family PLP-dependent enzyme, partial [Candidatus Latescibacteria bacterium]|nr:DSD1 family PLP-dependent enzyme [Candidatus Latescibacterota bacterium]
DAGRKASNNEYCMPRVVDRKGMTFTSLAAEHGYLALEGEGQSLRVGEKIQFIPGYSDLTVCLYNTFHGIRNGRVEAVWDIQGRGKLE